MNTESGAGLVRGGFSVPAFSAPVRLAGVLPAKLGVTLSDAAPLEGTVSRSEALAGDLELNMPARLDLGITSLQLFGLTIPMRCATTEPLSLALTDTLSSEELLQEGWSFSGSTTVPGIRCEGGVLGRLLGWVLSGMLAGPEDPYALKVSAPG